MDNAFISEMKQALEEEKAKLETELASVSTPDTGDHVPGEHNPTFPDYGDDVSDESSSSPAEVADYEVNIDVTQTLEKRHEEVVDALGRIEAGNYGTDENTGEAIPEARLRANPAARTNV